MLVQLSLETVLIQRAGFGQRLSRLSDEQRRLLFKVLYAGNFFFIAAVSSAKFSVLFFLSRLIPPHVNSRWFNGALWALYGLNAAWAIGVIFATVFFCNPVQKSWDPTLSGSCGREFDLYLGNAISSAIVDLFILILPMPKIWALQASTKRKLGLGVVLGFGYAYVSLLTHIEIRAIYFILLDFTNIV